MYSSQSVFYFTLIVLASMQISLAALGQVCVNNRCPNNELDAYCENNICSCQKGVTVAAPDNMKCLKLATSLGSGCEEDVQCTEKLSFYAFCNRNQCGCKTEATMVNGNCEKKRFLGDQCTANQQCSHIPHGLCTSSNPSDIASLICVCDLKYAPGSNASICLPIATIAQAPCEEDIQCSEGLGEGATCNVEANKCACKEGYHFNGETFTGKCVINKGISDSCSKDSKGDCYLPLDGDNQTIDCIDGTCRCKNGIMPRLENQSCNGAGSIGIYSVVWVLIISIVTTNMA